MSTRWPIFTPLGFTIDPLDYKTELIPHKEVGWARRTNTGWDDHTVFDRPFGENDSESDSNTVYEHSY